MGADMSQTAVGGPGTWANWSNPNGGQQTGILTQANNNNNTWAYTFATIIDGTSNTVLLGEASGQIGSSLYGVNEQNRFPIWAGGNPNNSGQGRQHNYFRVMDLNYPLNSQNTASDTGGAGKMMDRAFSSKHTNGANFLLGDGSVRFIANGITPATYRAAGTRAGGEALSLP
jgi:prepilin-type processing-associated H-X9-DG protein